MMVLKHLVGDMLKIRCDDLDRKCRNEGGGGGREGRECSYGICSVSALWALFTKRDVLCCVVLCSHGGQAQRWKAEVLKHKDGGHTDQIQTRVGREGGRMDIGFLLVSLCCVCSSPDVPFYFDSQRQFFPLFSCLKGVCYN